jgi:hypothetical protein
VRCWGENLDGQLGQGNQMIVGDNEDPSSVGTISIGAPVDDLFTGDSNTCVRIGAEIKCWGSGQQAFNGYSSTANLGDDEFPSSYGMVDLGMNVTSVHTSGSVHVCALGGVELRCWGRGTEGQLGYGNTDYIGNNEVPATAGSVPYF